MLFTVKTRLKTFIVTVIYVKQFLSTCDLILCYCFYLIIAGTPKYMRRETDHTRSRTVWSSAATVDRTQTLK